MIGSINRMPSLCVHAAQMRRRDPSADGGGGGGGAPATRGGVWYRVSANVPTAQQQAHPRNNGLSNVSHPGTSSVAVVLPHGLGGPPESETGINSVANRLPGSEDPWLNALKIPLYSPRVSSVVHSASATP
jgi:hypothetical protein